MESEHLQQVRIVAWFRKNYAEHLIFAIPNGGQRNKVVAAKLKAEGVLKGVPDLFIPSLHLFIEMKREEGGKLSVDQSDMKDFLEKHGYTVLVCHGFESAKDAIKNALEG